MDDLTFDARERQRLGQEPCGPIMEALAQLEPGQTLMVINTFETRPRERVWEGRRYWATVHQEGPEHFGVRLVKDPKLRPGDVPAVDRRDSRWI